MFYCSNRICNPRHQGFHDTIYQKPNNVKLSHHREKSSLMPDDTRCVSSARGEGCLRGGGLDWWRLADKGDGNPTRFPHHKAYEGWMAADEKQLLMCDHDSRWLSVMSFIHFHHLSVDCDHGSYLRGEIDGMEPRGVCVCVVEVLDRGQEESGPWRQQTSVSQSFDATNYEANSLSNTHPYISSYLFPTARSVTNQL